MDDNFSYTKIPHEMLRHWNKKLPRTAYILLEIILDISFSYRLKQIKITQEVLCNLCNRTIRTVQRNLQILKEENLLIINNGKKSHKLEANIYEINFYRLLKSKLNKEVI